ncbi:MAG: ThuA domain-containing protein [SAR324 cluster bacterium]|nr:ThuA domain-containing protein [SAR324 cluster bacterium]
MGIRATVWGENIHERSNAEVKKIYPDGMHTCIANGLSDDPEIETRTAVLQEFEHGLSKETLLHTDVLIWWGHCAHQEVSDEIVHRVQERVWEGMGLIVLHSGHYSKIFKKLMGTSCSLTWREAGEKERLWVVNPAHPIVKGIDRYFEVENSEMYGEPFIIPTPDEVIFISWFEGGEVFRSGVTYRRGAGNIFYFGSGHESYPIYYNESVKLVLKNAVKWAATGLRWIDNCPNIPVEKAPEKIVIKGHSVHKPGEAGFK